MEACWAQDPSERPSFESIARRIKAMQRWRKLIGKLRHAGEAAHRSHSMPVMRAPFRMLTQFGDDAAVGNDQNSEAARHVFSAPSPGQQQQQQHQPPQPHQSLLAEALRLELMCATPQPQWTTPLLEQLPPEAMEQADQRQF